MKQRIIPSIVAPNQKDLDLLSQKLKGVSKYLHLDIADGKFAPNHSLDFKCKLSDSFKYIVHVMAYDYQKWIKKYTKQIELFIVHVEVIKDLKNYIKGTHKHKKKVALALLPKTKVSVIEYYLKDIEYVLILTVNPGWYGSLFHASTLTKIAQIKRINPNVKVIVDGHMNPKIIKLAAKAGADYFISGSYVTLAKDPGTAMKEMENALKKA